MNSYQNSVTKLLPPGKGKKTLQQTIHFPNQFPNIPRSTLGPYDDALYDEKTNYLLPHVYASVISKSLPFKVADIYGVTIMNITSTSFEVVVRKLDKNKPWDDDLYLDWIADIFNSFNICTTVGTNMSSSVTDIEYTLLFKEPLHLQQGVGVVLQPYANSADIYFQTVVRHIDERSVVCSLRRLSGSTNEWNIPLKIFCRAFVGSIDIQTVKSGYFNVPTNGSGIPVASHQVKFPSQFQLHQFPQASIHVQYSIVSRNSDNPSDSGLFALTTKEVHNSHFSFAVQRLDDTEAWSHPVKLFWIAQITFNPYIPFAGNPPRKYAPTITSNTVPQQSHSIQSTSSAPYVAPQTVSSNSSIMQRPQESFVPQNQPQYFQPNAPHPQQQPQQYSAPIPRTQNFNELIYMLIQRPNEQEKMTILAFNQHVVTRYTATEIASLLQAFGFGKKEAFAFIVSTGRVDLNSPDLPVILQHIPLENDKFEILKVVKQYFPSLKLTPSDARSTIGQFTLQKSRYDSLELLVSFIVEAKKNAKVILTLFDDKDYKKLAKKKLGVSSFSIF